MSLPVRICEGCNGPMGSTASPATTHQPLGEVLVKSCEMREGPRKWISQARNEKSQKSLFLLDFWPCELARTTGLEPATTGSTVRYSNQLSYVPSDRFRLEDPGFMCLNGRSSDACQGPSALPCTLASYGRFFTLSSPFSDKFSISRLARVFQAETHAASSVRATAMSVD